MAHVGLLAFSLPSSLSSSATNSFLNLSHKQQQSSCDHFQKNANSLRTFSKRHISIDFDFNARHNHLNIVTMSGTSACDSTDKSHTNSRRQFRPLDKRPELVGAVPLWAFFTLISRLQSTPDTLKGAKSSDQSRNSHTELSFVNHNQSSTSLPAETDSTDPEYQDIVSKSSAEILVAPEMEGVNQTDREENVDPPKGPESTTAPSDQLEPPISDSFNPDSSTDSTVGVETPVAEQNGVSNDRFNDATNCAMDALQSRVRALEDALKETDACVAEWRAQTELAMEEARTNAIRLENDAVQYDNKSRECSRALFHALMRSQTQHAAAAKAVGQTPSSEKQSLPAQTDVTELEHENISTSRAMFDAMMRAQTLAAAARSKAYHARAQSLLFKGLAEDGVKAVITVMVFTFILVSVIVSSPSVRDALLRIVFPILSP